MMPCGRGRHTSQPSSFPTSAITTSIRPAKRMGAVPGCKIVLGTRSLSHSLPFFLVLQGCMASKFPSLYATFIILCTALNMFLFARRLQGLRRQPILYTYVGDDFPEFLPHEPVRGDLSMTFFEDPASSFPISGPGTAELWESIYPPGYGFVRLGDESRLLCVAMFHQLHCIEKMRIFLDDPTNKHVAFGHQQHCMNYLRQLFLCKADLTFEPIIALDYPAQALDSSVDLVMKSGSRVVHSCGDWETVYDTVGDNYKKWKASWNISSPFTSESE